MGTLPGAGRGQTRPGQQRQHTHLQPVTIDDIVQEEVVTATRDTPVRTVAAQMAENDVGAVVVVDDDEPMGVITDRKIALSVETQPDIGQQPVEQLLGSDVATADPSMTVSEALGLMNEREIRRLPIVDDDNTLQGIVTLDDVLVLLGTEFEQAATIIQSQSPRF